MTMRTTTAVGRRAARAYMVDRCTVTRPSTADPTLNETTGQLTYASGTEVYAGPCRIRLAPQPEQEETAQERVVTVRRWLVSIPVMASYTVATDVEVDDVVTVTTCVGDPSMVGRTLAIRAVDRGTTATAHRLSCEEQTS